MRLYLLDFGQIQEIGSPIGGYLVRLDDGTNVLVDTGCTREMIDGDTTLHPGVELIDSTGHAPGHQSVLVRLPCTGPVLLADDAIAHHDQLDPDSRFVGHHDHDETGVRASTRKLVDLATAEGVRLIVHSHDREQWPTLRHAPAYYD